MNYFCTKVGQLLNVSVCVFPAVKYAFLNECYCKTMLFSFNIFRIKNSSSEMYDWTRYFPFLHKMKCYACLNSKPHAPMNLWHYNWNPILSSVI